MQADYKSSNDTKPLSFYQLRSAKSLPKHRVSVWRSNIVHNSWFSTTRWNANKLQEKNLTVVIYMVMTLEDYWKATDINSNICYTVIFGDFQHLTFAFRSKRNPYLAQVVFLFRCLIYWRLYQAIVRREKCCYVFVYWTWKGRCFVLLFLLTLT